QQVVQTVIDDYADHAALWGYLLTDEPHLRHFENLAQLTSAFQSRDPERVPLINLFPNYASPARRNGSVLGTASAAQSAEG
ncbi:MAG: hypothetical protein MUQ30_05840, partial [Anaerolineae bacterium]|nr:hypothetical protein [Anaerolineae bacterium]